MSEGVQETHEDCFQYFDADGNELWMEFLPKVDLVEVAVYDNHDSRAIRIPRAVLMQAAARVAAAYDRHDQPRRREEGLRAAEEYVAEFEREHGPIPPEAREEARRALGIITGEDEEE